MEFWEILEFNMQKTNLSNYRLAKMIGVHPSTVANWRAGITEPKYETILKIEDIFKVAIVRHAHEFQDTPGGEIDPGKHKAIQLFVSRKDKP